MRGNDPTEVILAMIGHRLRDIIAYGWIERDDGHTCVALGQRVYDFVLDDSIIVFRGDETTLTVQARPKIAQLDPDLYPDYSEFGEPCSASIFNIVSFAGESGPTIDGANVYRESKLGQCEAILFAFKQTGLSLFLELAYDRGVQLSSPLEEEKRRQWYARTRQEFTITTQP